MLREDIWLKYLESDEQHKVNVNHVRVFGDGQKTQRCCDHVFEHGFVHD